MSDESAIIAGRAVLAHIVRDRRMHRAGLDDQIGSNGDSRRRCIAHHLSRSMAEVVAIMVAEVVVAAVEAVDSNPHHDTSQPFARAKTGWDF